METTGIPGLMLCLAVLHLASCIRDDRDDCEYPLRLHFTYNYNREQTDLLHDEVPCIDLCLYDSNSGIIMKHTKIQEAELDDDGNFIWNVPEGRFTLVAWGGIESRYELDTKSPLLKALLTLPATDGYIPHKREHLWHNTTADILVNGSVTPVYDIDLRKISNDLTITVHCADDDIDISAFSSKVTASNNRYDAVGTIAAGTLPAEYRPGLTRSSSSHYYTLLGIDHGDDSILDVNLGEIRIYSGSLTELISRQPNIVFGLDDDFIVDFEIASTGQSRLSVSLSVNGWTISDYSVALK